MTTTSKKNVMALTALLSLALTISIPSAFAHSQDEQDPWDDYRAVPNSTTGDERADANAGSSDVYANISTAQFTTKQAYVYQNEDSGGVGSTPSHYLGAGANNLYIDVTYDYNGHITANAWGGIAELYLGAKVYENGSLHSFHGEVVDGAGSHSSSNDIQIYNINPNDNKTYKASGYFKAKAQTFVFSGQQTVDFWNNDYDVLIQDITLRH